MIPNPISELMGWSAIGDASKPDPSSDETMDVEEDVAGYCPAGLGWRNPRQLIKSSHGDSRADDAGSPPPVTVSDRPSGFWQALQHDN